jgi:hypothetical protein
VLKLYITLLILSLYKQHGYTSMNNIDFIPIDRDSRTYQDLRDRAAYLYIMGSFPSSLGNYMATLLTLVSRSVQAPSALDGSTGRTQVDREMAERLQLEQHPMVRRAQMLIAEGYGIDSVAAQADTRPYGRIYMRHRKTAHPIVVLIDGSVCERIAC